MREVYDGKLLPDVQVNTFRNIALEQVVVVVWGALPKPTGKEVIEDADFFSAVCRALR